MEKYYLLIALIIYIVVITIYGTRLQLEKYKRKEAEKQATGHMTDAEKLHYIAEIYKSVDFKKVNYDLLKDWQRFIDKLASNQKNIPAEFNDIVNNKFFDLI